MTDREIEQYVDALAERVPHVDPPLGAVLRDGRAAGARRARQRGAVALAGLVAAVAAIAAVPAVIGSGREAGAPAGPVTSTAGPEPVPPSGTRFVGADGVVMAVPVGWENATAYEVSCSPPDSDFVYLAEEQESGFMCPMLPEVHSPQHASLRISTFDPAPTTGPPDCNLAGCMQKWTLAGVVFQAFVPGDESLTTLAALDDSLQVLPDGWTTSEVDGRVVPMP